MKKTKILLMMCMFAIVSVLSVNVYAAPINYHLATSMSFEKTQYDVHLGGSITVVPTVSPSNFVVDQYVNYSSSDTSVATVDKYTGEATGRSCGKTTITAAIEPEYTLSTRRMLKSYDLYVVNHVRDIIINGYKTMDVQNGPKQFDMVIEPENHSDNVSVMWTSLNSRVATVDKDTGVVTPVRPGRCTIRADFVVTYYIGNTEYTNFKTYKTMEVVVTNDVPPGSITGDIDKNGVVNANDASVVLDLFKNQNATPADIVLGDMDGNGLLNANDASLILDYFKDNY